MFWFQRSRILSFVQNEIEARGWSERRILQAPVKLAEPKGRKCWFQEEGGEFCSICTEFKFEVMFASVGGNVYAPFRMWS